MQVQTPTINMNYHFKSNKKRELQTAQLKKKIDRMLTLDIVQESLEENPEVVKMDDMMRITNNTPFREASSGFRKTGFSLI
tara:strand:- start:64 stop:306 length:243 start_codon:yes stop_codon:yes gene_type:complete